MKNIRMYEKTRDIFLMSLVFFFLSIGSCFADSTFRIAVKDTTLSVLIENSDFYEQHSAFYHMFCLEYGKLLQARYSDLKDMPIVVEFVKNETQSSTKQTQRITFRDESVSRRQQPIVRELVVSIQYDKLFSANLKGLGEVSVQIDDKDENNEILNSSSIKLTNTTAEVRKALLTTSAFFGILAKRNSQIQIKEYRSFESSEVSRSTYTLRES